MSLESAKKCLAKIKADSAFADSLKKAPDMAAASKLIKAAGFDFTKDEFNKARAEAGEKLSDADLDKVAGGCGVYFGCVTKYPWS